MTAKYERQPDMLPTNKATVSGGVAVLVATYAGPVVAEIWPQIAPALLAGPAITEFLTAATALLAGLFVAWWVPDRAGVPA